MHGVDYGNFVQTLLHKVPEFQPTYHQHVVEFDEVLPHVLMGDFTRFFYLAYLRSNEDNPDAQKWRNVVRDSLGLLEEAISSSDSRLRNLISVSFLENLVPSIEGKAEQQQTYKQVKELLGPKLREELQLYDADS